MKLIYCNAAWEQKNKTNSAIENFLEKVEHFDELILAEHNGEDFFLYYLYTTRLHFFNNLISKSDFEELSKVFDIKKLKIGEIAQVKTAVGTSVDMCIKLNDSGLYLFLNNTENTIETLEQKLEILDLKSKIKSEIENLINKLNKFSIKASKQIEHKYHL